MNVKFCLQQIRNTSALSNMNVRQSSVLQKTQNRQRVKLFSQKETSFNKLLDQNLPGNEISSLNSQKEIRTQNLSSKNNSNEDVMKSMSSAKQSTISSNLPTNSKSGEINYFPKKSSFGNDKNSSFINKKPMESSKQPVVSITYEEIGLFPRSFNRVFDRFFKQVFSDVENLVVQEYRFYRYLFLTTVKCLFILIFVPFIVNFVARTYLIKPLTEYYWNARQPEIFLNTYQQKRAFSELKDFEEKIYFESLIMPCKNIKQNQQNMSNNVGSRPVGDSQKFPVDKRDSFDDFSDIVPTVGSFFNKTENHLFAEKMFVSSLTRNDQHYPIPIDNVKNFGNNVHFMSNTFSVENAAEEFPLVEKTKKMVTSDQKLVSYRVGGVFSIVENIDNSQLIIKNSANLLHPVINKRNTDHTQIIDNSTCTQVESIQQRLQQKTLELAVRYNDQSIEAITNFFADSISFITLCFLFFSLEIQINITKSFLLEVFFGLDDSKKSLLILLSTDLLVGYHSSNLWELFFQFIFYHYGLPESETSIFLLVATLPVLLDVLFKYLIFRHLNRASPATVATYHAMIE